MKHLFKNIFYLFLVLILLSACQSVKDGLTGKKQNNQDEFLVEKKNPLVLPPGYDILPEPKTLNELSTDEEEINLKRIVKKNTSSTKTTTTNKVSNISVEKSILDKIKSN
jgi:hypothetical protein